MTTTERVEALWELYERLDALLTPDEIDVLDPLAELIETLQEEEE